MTDKAYAVPLHELLASVPREARLVIDDDDGMGTRFIPVGRYCNEAAEALRARLAQPKEPDWSAAGFGRPSKREWVGLTDEEIDETAWPYFIGNIMPSVKIIVRQLEAKLKEKNGY